MTSSYSILLKSLSPGIMGKTLRSLDRLTLWIVSICWMVTIIVIFCAIYTINLSAAAKRAAEQALVAEPVLPRITRGGVGGKDLQVMIERMQRRYPDVAVQWQNNGLTIAGKDGARYRQWLIAIGQADTLSPQFHWKIRGFCVGSLCDGQNLMSIDLVGEKVLIEMPQLDQKK